MLRDKRTLAGVAIVGLVVLAGAYRWWASDERAIRNQLASIAGALTVREREGEFGPLTRVAVLRKTLAPDIRVAAGSQEIASRDAVLAVASRWVPPPGGVTVEFADVQVTVGRDRMSAEVYCTAKITGRAATGEPTVDARELTAGFVKQDGVWLVGAVRTQETLTR